MKTLVLAALLLAPAAALFPTKDPGQDPSPLAGHMETLQEGFKALRKSTADPAQKAAALTTVGGMQAAALASISMPPKAGDGVTGEVNLAEHRIGYQRRMAAVYDGLLQLELALHQGKADEVTRLMKELNDQKKAGHDVYNQ